MNSTQPPSKRSSVERSVDYIIFFMFGLLFSMCITGCIYFAWWTATYMPRHWYLDPTNVPREYDSSQPVIVGVTNFITAFILYGARARGAPLWARVSGTCRRRAPDACVRWLLLPRPLV
jgi:hypothetical protein